MANTTHIRIVQAIRNIVNKHQEISDYCDLYADSKLTWSNKADRLIQTNESSKTVVITLVCDKVYIKRRSCYKPTINVALDYQYVNGCHDDFVVIVDCGGKRYLGTYKSSNTAVSRSTENTAAGVADSGRPPLAESQETPRIDTVLAIKVRSLEPAA